MTALRTLIEAVEAGGFPIGRAADAFGDRHGSTPIDRHWGIAHDAFHGSVDAALALMEAVLPGWDWEGGTLSRSATVYPPGYPGKNFEDPCYSAEANTPARALLLAILKALEATTTGKE